jgi:hypothetical protein
MCIYSYKGLRLWCLTPLQQYLSYIVVVSFIENHRPVASYWRIYHNLFYRVHLVVSGNRTHSFSQDICTFCTGSCKSNYHMITTMTVPIHYYGFLFTNNKELNNFISKPTRVRDPRDRNCIAVGFTTTYAISKYHH